jgi:hypothetical protein
MLLAKVEFNLARPGGENGHNLSSGVRLTLYSQKLYRKFEFTSLRQQVLIAEKLCYIAPEIRRKGRVFTVFPE